MNESYVISMIKAFAGEYYKWALEARKEYIKLRLRQDPEIRAVYNRAAEKIARELQNLVPATPSQHLHHYQLEMLEKALRKEAEAISQKLHGFMESYIEKAVEAGSDYSRKVVKELLTQAGFEVKDIDQLFYAVNRRAIEACWARTKNGLFLSDRIWEQGEKFRNIIRDIIQEAVATGEDAIKTARILEQYVKQGARTLARDYPKMMERIGKKRIPEDICYEALRLARTETTAAFGEGTIAAARICPSYIGIKWVLSHQHPMADTCDTLAEHDEGLGKGVYSPGNEPPYPAHPNCLCVLVPVHEELDKFVERLKRWQEEPGEETEIEMWYNYIYLGKDKQEALAEVIEKVEKALIKRTTERAVVIDEDGHTIMKKDGGESSVTFTKEEREKFKDKIFIHNHPRSSSFSPEDVNFAIANNIKIMRACGLSRRYYLNRPPQGWMSYSEWKTLYREKVIKYDIEVEREFMQKIEKGELSIPDAERLHWHEVWSRFFREEGIEYGYETWRDDK